MKEKEFFKRVFFRNYTWKKGQIVLSIYYSLDDKGNVLLDKESMEEEFKSKLKEVEEILN